jgi:hypothetical protein
MLDVAQILDRDRFAIVLFAGDGDLRLREFEFFAGFGDEFPKSRRGRFCCGISFDCFLARACTRRDVGEGSILN